ncbi:MAG: hypothetical protein ABIG31_04565 [Candidatus Omnitrophota bacterium]
MGVIYKLKQEVINFILEQKKANPVLSCRQLTKLIEDKFQIKVSKSSINSIIKQAGLSMPVGRRIKKRRRPKTPQIHIMPKIPPVPMLEFKQELPAKPEEPKKPVIEEPGKPIVQKETLIPVPVELSPEIELKKPEAPLEPICTGAIFLKAADCLMGGSYYMAEGMKNRLRKQGKELITNIEFLIYLQLLGLKREFTEKELRELWPLVGRRVTNADISSYLNELQSVETISADLIKAISNTLQEIRCIKTTYPDGNVLYLDGQLHTVWSTPHIPYDFSATLYNLKSYINEYLYKENPFILFMAPGYDTPTKDFFHFIVNLDSHEQITAKMTFYNNKFEEIELAPFEKIKRRFFIFGLWPWQFLEHRKVKNIAEFKPVYFEPLKKDLYLAQVEMELLQPELKKSVTLRGAALKTSLDEKSRLIILSNLPEASATTSDIAISYIKKWPNLEEAFQDFSRKIELFTYTANSQRFFSPESLNLDMNTEQEASVLLKNYLRVLDLYVKWHFLPSGSEDVDLPTTNERFYSLKARLDCSNDYCRVIFQPLPSYPHLKELAYACRRVNEKEIKDYQGRTIWLCSTA